MTIDGKLATGHQFPNVWILISSTHRSHGRMDPGCSNHRTPTCFGAKVDVAHAVAAPDPRPQPLRTQGKHWALGNSNISMGIYPQNMALYGFTWYSTSIFGFLTWPLIHGASFWGPHPRSSSTAPLDDEQPKRLPLASAHLGWSCYCVCPCMTKSLQLG